MNIVQEFKEFAMKGNMVDMAVCHFYDDQGHEQNEKETDRSSYTRTSVTR